MKIITLIQKQPKIYKLDGNEKLRVVKELPDANSRFTTVEQLLDILTT